MQQLIRMLFLPRETFPTFRGRIAVLFGRELMQRGHKIDVIMQAADDVVSVGAHNWEGRTVWVGPTDTGETLGSRIRRHVRGFLHDMGSLWARATDEYDAVLVSDKYLIAALAVVICKVRRLQFFFWLTFPEHESQLLRAQTGSARYPGLAAVRGRAMSWLLYSWIIPMSDHVFVQSSQMALNLRRRCHHAPSMTPVLTGFDPADFPAPISAVAPSSSGHFTLAYLGTLDAERRLEVLVDMLARVRAAGMPMRLLLIGDGDLPADRELLERKAKELHVDRYMEVTGFLPRREALERLRSADAGISLFFPNSILEVASPTKLVEYMAMGLPVIVNNHPEQRLVVRESRAGVCTPWGAGHFARAVRWLIARGAADRHLMGQRGRRWAMENRTYAAIATGLESKLTEILRMRKES